MSIQERWNDTFMKLDRSAPAQRADEDSEPHPAVGKERQPEEKEKDASTRA